MHSAPGSKVPINIKPVPNILEIEVLLEPPVEPMFDLKGGVALAGGENSLSTGMKTAANDV